MYLVVLGIELYFQEDTVRVIYSYNDIDPANDTALFYHGPTTRGTKSVSLLSEFQVPDNLPSDLRHIEFLQRNVSVYITEVKVDMPLQAPFRLNYSQPFLYRYSIQRKHSFY